MASGSADDELTPKETEQRREAAIKKMLATPPKPHTPKAKPSRSAPKPFSTKAEKSKRNKVGPAHQKVKQQRGR